jgi:hypothetical protein
MANRTAKHVEAEPQEHDRQKRGTAAIAAAYVSTYKKVGAIK